MEDGYCPNPNLAKLDDDIALNDEIISKIEQGIFKLTNVEVIIEYPKFGVSPYKNHNPGLVQIAEKEGKKLGNSNTIWNKLVAKFNLREMYGCCGILVSYHSYIAEPYRKKGIATFLQEIKEDIARVNGYTSLYATTVSDNDAENKLLLKSGWIKVHEFVNARTGHTVFEWVKTIKNPKINYYVHHGAE